MTPERKHNLLVAPFVFLVRLPLLLPFWLLAEVGKIAEGCGVWLGRRLPSLKQERRHVR